MCAFPRISTTPSGTSPSTVARASRASFGRPSPSIWPEMDGLPSEVVVGGHRRRGSAEGAGAPAGDGPAVGPRNGNGPRCCKHRRPRFEGLVALSSGHIFPGAPWGVKHFSPPFRPKSSWGRSARRWVGDARLRWRRWGAWES